jgi:hypothetical protein
MVPDMERRIEPRRLTVVPRGKFQGCLIATLPSPDLEAVRREFWRVDPAVQIAVGNELRRRRLALRSQRKANREA